MITSPAFSGKHYAVFGLARSGLATVDALRASGADVVAWDDGEAARARTSAPLVDLNAADLNDFDALVVSPGVPLNTHPLAARARAAGVEVIGDIELFARVRPSLPAHRVVAVTGTNGKSTTTALIHHIVETAGIPARLGGNIGLPILGQDPLPAGVCVLEVSSFQIDLVLSLDAEVAVLLNISRDHLERYDSFEMYAASKARLLAMQSPDHVAIVSSESEHSRRIAAIEQARRPVTMIAAADVTDQSAWPALQGPHNAENVAAARAAARALGIGEEAIEEALRSYPGLPHRMERVGEVGGVLYVNDSKATNPTSTAPALRAYPSIHWIAGGRAKTAELDAVIPHLGSVCAAYLVGEAETLFAALLEPHVAIVRAGTIAAATRLAADNARPGDVVLLSPACASYDQFTDFEARGVAFREAVGGLVT